jgi:hypothetical protein
MPAERGQLRDTTPATATKSCGTSETWDAWCATGTQRSMCSPHRLAHWEPAPSESATCMGTPGSGAQTGTARHTTVRLRWMILPALPPGDFVSCVAASRRVRRPRSAVRAVPIPGRTGGTMALVSVWRGAIDCIDPRRIDQMLQRNPHHLTAKNKTEHQRMIHSDTATNCHNHEPPAADLLLPFRQRSVSA